MHFNEIANCELHVWMGPFIAKGQETSLSFCVSMLGEMTVCFGLISGDRISFCLARLLMKCHASIFLELKNMRIVIIFIFEGMAWVSTGVCSKSNTRATDEP